ncbi:MAG: ATP-grasp domain-containing protein [Xanthobacteraceae bacterium]
MNNAAQRTRTSPKGAIVLGGAHGSLAIARSLGRRGISVWLITADNPLASFSRFVERSFRWRGPSEEGALDFLLDLVRRHGLDDWILFAGSDEDVQFVARNHAALGARFTLTTPAWEQLRWALDKRLMNARAEQLGIARPRTWYPEASGELAPRGIAFPAVIKPTLREGRNRFVDAKAWRVDDQRTLLAYYQEAKSVVGADRIMVQELIPGDGMAQFSYAALWHRGRPIGSLMARRRRQFPVTFGYTSTFVETIEEPQIEADACRFLASLEYSGLVEIEFKYDARDGQYKILDVNTRPWTWIAIGATAGIDFPTLQWRLAAGEEMAPLRGRPGVCWRYLSRDLAAIACQMFADRLSPLTYLRSLRRPLASAVFAWDDPLPALLDLPVSAARVAGRWLRRRKSAAAPILQSVNL